MSKSTPKFLRHGFSLLLAASTLSAIQLRASVINVPGTSDPYLAGMPNGSTASSGDTAPGQSPVFAGFVTAGTHLTWTATGVVGHPGNDAGPDGDAGAYTTHILDGAQNGISNINAPIDSLLGVFLDASAPDGSPAPAMLDFSGGTGYSSLSPLLKQLFFMGDGLTGTGSGSVQEIVVPAGATRLYLGTMDGYGWFNNTGFFDVTVNGARTGNVPDAGGSLSLALLGFGGIVALRKSRLIA